MIYTKEHAEALKSRAGTSWRPENETEEAMFARAACFHCSKCEFIQGTYGCKISDAAFITPPDAPDYPPEWVYGADGQPTCTAFAPVKGETP